MNRIRQLYSTAGVIWLNITLLLVLLLAGAGLLGRRAEKRSDASLRIVRKYGVPLLKRVYPQYSEAEMLKLLEESWTRTYRYQPFVQFSERPFQGTYVNVDCHGIRRGDSPASWPPNPAAFNIFFFGGSTAFGYGVADGDTIAANLQRCLRREDGKEVRVYNFGCGYYYSTQERILFEQLLQNGCGPDLAIFLDGLNEFYNDKDEPLFTPQLTALMDQSLGLSEVIEDARVLHHSAVLKAVASVVVRVNRRLGCAHMGLRNLEKNEVTEEAADGGGAAGQAAASSRAIVQRYLKNRDMIAAVAERFHVRAAFVWQPVPTYKYDLTCHLLAGSRFDDVMATQCPAGYAWLASYAATNALGRDFIWAADMQEQEKQPLYVDKIHYSAAMSEKVALLIAQELVKRKLVEADLSTALKAADHPL